MTRYEWLCINCASTKVAIKQWTAWSTDVWSYESSKNLCLGFPLRLVSRALKSQMLFISPIIPSITSGVVRSRADLLCGSKYEAPDRVHSSSLSRFVFWTWGHASIHRPTRNGSRSSKARRDDHQWRRVYRLKVSQKFPLWNILLDFQMFL